MYENKAFFNFLIIFDLFCSLSYENANDLNETKLPSFCFENALQLVVRYSRL